MKTTPGERAYNQEYQRKHRAGIAAYQRAYGIAHRAARAAYDRAHRASHRAAHAEANRKYRLAHLDRVKARGAAHYIANRVKIAAYHHAHLSANRAVYQTRTQRWRRAHPDLVSYYTNKHRALKAGNGGSHTPQEWRDKCALLGNVCIYCGAAKKLTRDHQIPLSRGGTDDIANIVPACRSCNSRKHTKTAQEFLALKEAA